VVEQESIQCTLGLKGGFCCSSDLKWFFDEKMDSPGETKKDSYPGEISRNTVGFKHEIAAAIWEAGRYMPYIIAFYC
jgi:hypothetical protein